jgi:hypothetical protein
MTTATQEQATLVEGTRFRLVPVEVTWTDRGLDNLGDKDDMGLGFMNDYLGDRNAADPEDLPVCDGAAEPAVAWTLQHVLHTELRFPKLWRRADAEYLGRELHAACPDVWTIAEWRPFRDNIPDRVSMWLGMVARLFNRGVPRQLLVGCRQFVEAAG